MWIKCEDRLPETPKTWSEYVNSKKTYMVCWETIKGRYGYQAIDWCDGWNCSMRTDGSISRDYEITNIVAWFEIPEYKG